MSESLNNQENKRLRPKAKLFGLPRPLAGALIGILSFLVTLLLLERAGLEIFGMGLVYPGLVIISLTDIPEHVFMIYAISSIPAAIIGLLFSSNNATAELFGVIGLVTYILLWILFSILFMGMA